MTNMDMIAPLNTRGSFKYMALQVSGHRTEDTSQGPQIGQITYHLADSIRKLWEHVNL